MNEIAKITELTGAIVRKRILIGYSILICIMIITNIKPSNITIYGWIIKDTSDAHIWLLTKIFLSGLFILYLMDNIPKMLFFKSSHHNRKASQAGSWENAENDYLKDKKIAYMNHLDNGTQYFEGDKATFKNEQSKALLYHTLSDNFSRYVRFFYEYLLVLSFTITALCLLFFSSCLPGEITAIQSNHSIKQPSSINKHHP